MVSATWTLDGPGQIPQPAELLAVGEKLPCSDGASSDSSSECGCTLCCPSCASLDGSDVEGSEDERQQSLGAPFAASCASAGHMRPSQVAASSDQIPSAAGCLCTPPGLEKVRDAGKPACAKEVTLIGAPLSRATKAFCQQQARQLAKRVAKGSWTIDLLLFLRHLPRISRASLACEVLNGRVAIVLVDEGRLTAKKPSKVPSRQYDGHFVVLCGVAIAIPTADGTHASWEREIIRSESVLGYANTSSQGITAGGEPMSGNFSLTVDAAQRAFAAGLTACQVKAFLIRDPLHPGACWLTPDRLDICRTADGKREQHLLGAAAKGTL
ncbi:hypothetical protein Emag_003314 [Eimeria magna]